MARKDKPYLPLYVQDVLTDEKLIECSAQAHGVYFRLLCILHKQEKYGLLCLKQKYKQNESKSISKVEEFARMLARQMPFKAETIQASLEELLEEKVISIEDDALSQKRMVADGELSLIRADVGKTGGSSVTKQYGKPGFLYWIGDSELKNKIGISVNITNRLYRLRSDLKLKKLTIQDSIKVIDMGAAEDFSLDYFNGIRDGEWVNIPHSEMKIKFALLKAKLEAKELANNQANADIENEYISNDLINDLNQIVFNTQEPKIEKKHEELFRSMMVVYKTSFPAYFDDFKADYPACVSIAQKTEKLKNWASNSVLNGHFDEFIDFWGEVVQYVANDNWLSSRSLKDLSTREWQRLGQHMSKPPKDRVKKNKKDENKSEYERLIEEKREAARNKTYES